MAIKTRSWLWLTHKIYKRNITQTKIPHQFNRILIIANQTNKYIPNNPNSQKNIRRCKFYEYIEKLDTPQNIIAKWVQPFNAIKLFIKRKKLYKNFKKKKNLDEPSLEFKIKYIRTRIYLQWDQKLIHKDGLWTQNFVWVEVFVAKYSTLYSTVLYGTKIRIKNTPPLENVTFLYMKVTTFLVINF